MRVGVGVGVWRVKKLSFMVLHPLPSALFGVRRLIRFALLSYAQLSPPAQTGKHSNGLMRDVLVVVSVFICLCWTLDVGIFMLSVVVVMKGKVFAFSQGPHPGDLPSRL